MLTDLAVAARKSGLRVVELPNWKTNKSPGGFGEGYTEGVLVHHTGSYDGIGDTSSDLNYAKWLGFEGRPDLSPPLCNLGLSAECVVYVCAAGNANHGGVAKASGPMLAGDATEMYVGIEAYNSGSQGWNSKGKDAFGNEVTQYEAYVRLCAALCSHYGWPASHVRGHKETSVTGKWDPGGINMGLFRGAIRLEMKNPTQQEDDMPEPKELWNSKEVDLIPNLGVARGDSKNENLRPAWALAFARLDAYKAQLFARQALAKMDVLLEAFETQLPGVSKKAAEAAEKAVHDAMAEGIDITVSTSSKEE